MPTTKTPLRYPGGKSQLVGLIREMIAFKREPVATYVEPYCGGAGIAMRLLLSGEVERIALNDADPGIFSFWYAVFNESERLVEKISEVPVNVATWQNIRQERAEILSGDVGSQYSFELGFQTFYLNRTTHSGIIDGGVLGGLHQQGKTKIDCRFNKGGLINKIREIAAQRDRVSITCEDGVSFLKMFSALESSDLSEALVYLDPPYMKQGRYLYMNNMSQTNHADLRDYLRGVRNFDWLLTYDDVELVRSLYAPFDLRGVNVRYSANRKGMAGEVAVFSEKFASFSTSLVVP